MSWEDFTRLLERIADAVGGPEAMRGFTEEQLSADTLVLFRTIGRVLAAPRDVFELGARWVGPSLFPMIHAEIWERSEGMLVERLTLAPGHRDCPTLFHCLHGAIAVLPRSWGHGDARVELDLAPGSAVYSIHLPSARRGPLARLVRAIRARVAFPALLRELEGQQRAIDAAYRDQREANARITAQATDLARVDSIGRELSRDVDLDRVLDALIRILREDLEFAGAELWLQAQSRVGGGAADAAAPSPQRVRATGVGVDATAVHYGLESAGRRLGELVVQPRAGADDGSPTRILSLLVPWIALALDNAMTYAQLARHADLLEQRVEERTSRLLAANQHLLREIDERKRTTEALLQSEEQLRASERLASIGTLAAGIAHEINNPIGAILAAAQLAQMQQTDAGSTPELESALADIVAESRRCGDIVRSVLQFAREERTDKWECLLRDLVVRSLRVTSVFTDRHGVRVVAELPESSPRVLANPTQIEQAIVNLIRNAAEAGATEIRVRLRGEPGERFVLIEVIDDGNGISESDRLRIVEPFYTTRRASGGTGLGLSVVHGIALEHGGSLEVASPAGGGAKLTLSLPRLP